MTAVPPLQLEVSTPMRSSRSGLGLHACTQHARFDALIGVSLVALPPALTGQRPMNLTPRMLLNAPYHWALTNDRCLCTRISGEPSDRPSLAVQLPR